MLNILKNDFSDPKVYAEQVRLLYKPFMVSIAATLTASSLLVVAQWDFISHDVLIGWLLALTVVTALRAFLAYFYKRKNPDAEESKRWGNLFIIGASIAGITWGLGAILLFPDNNEAHQILLVLVLVTICSGAVTTTSVIRNASFSLIIPMLLPLMPLLIMAEGQLTDIIALMVVLSFIFYLKSSNNIYNNTRESICLRLAAEAKEQALQEKTQQLQSVISHAPLVLWANDKDGVFTFSDGKALENMGLEPGQVVGQSVFELYKDYPKLVSSVKRALAGESFVEEICIGELWFESHYIACYDDKGGNKGYIGVAVDISERKKYEQALILAKNKAEAANETKSKFLGHMSHELRTPLNAILGFGQLLEMNSKEFNEDQKDSVKRILDAGEHLLALITDILDLTQIEADKLELHMQDVSVDEVLKESLSLIVNQAEARQLELIDNISSKGYMIRADLLRFKQVLLNMLSNAVKYNHEQGRIRLDSKIIDEKILRINITDAGEGLTEEDIGRLFVPFERLNTSMNVNGAGLGLVITKNLIEFMNGTMGVESKLGEGSTFWIELELANKK